MNAVKWNSFIFLSFSQDWYLLLLLLFSNISCQNCWGLGIDSYFFQSCCTSSPLFATLGALAGLAILATFAALSGLAGLAVLAILAGFATLAYSGGGSDADTRECVDRVS